jgi:uncharacterized integral membrane protein
MVYLVLIICLLVGSALTIVALQNLSTEVQFMLFTWSTPRIPLGILVLVAFLLGALVLYIISLLSAVQDRREVRRLQRRVTELERAATRAPSGPLPKGPFTWSFFSSADVVSHSTPGTRKGIPVPQTGCHYMSYPES